MDVKIYPQKLSGTIEAVSSKSLAHRFFIAAALSCNETEIYMNNRSKDVKATIECLNSLGAKIIRTDNVYKVTPVSLREEDNALAAIPSLNACESGSTLRFLIPVATALKRSVDFIGEGSLLRRPVHDLLYALKGVGFTAEKLPFTLSGRLLSGEYRIVGDVSSQYISGLMVALPLLSGDSEIVLSTELVSAPYAEMTIWVLKQFGIKIEKTERGFFVRGNQKYISPEKISVEGDYSGAAYFLAANFLGGSVKVTNLPESSVQGDKSVVSLIDKITDGDATFSAKNIPDLIPVLSVCACFAKGRTIIICDAARLKTKESDRLTALTDSLSKMGADIVKTEDGLIINGKKTLNGGVIVDSFGDHRIAMAVSLAATFAENPTTLLTAEAIRKSYPEFFNHMQMLGGRVDVL